MYWRFGYNWDGITPYTPPIPIAELAKPWTDIQKTLTDVKSHLHEHQRPAITAFVRHIVLGEPVPSALWDLNNANSSPLRGHFNPKLVVNPRSFDKTVYYFIQSAGASSPNDVSWELLVEDPATALECYRRDLGPSVVDVARLFLHTGRPFSTHIRLDRSHVPAHPHYLDAPISLGW